MPRRSQEERRSSTRAALLAAGRELFATRGFADVPAEQIVRTAGVTRGAMYHHFGDKTELFAAVFEQLEAEITDDLVASLAEVPADALVPAAISAFLDICARPDVLRIALTDAPAALGWQRWREIERRHGLGLVNELLAQRAAASGTDVPPFLGQVVLGAVIEAALLIAHADDPAAARREAEASLGALLAGLDVLTYPRAMAEFTGFPEAALDFYDDLEMDNTKSFWEAHRATYDEAVAAPMKALVGALEPEFGTAKVFRPYRDVRFAKDKTPYKTHQGAYIAQAPSTGYYVQIGARRACASGVGFYEASSDRLAAIRAAIDDDAPRRRSRGDPRRADVGRLGARRRPAQDRAARLRRRPPPHRAAAAQVDDARQEPRLRAGHPHPRAARPGTRRLARGHAVRRVGPRPREGLNTHG